MLLQLVVENFLSFRERAALSMLAADDVEHAPNQTIEGPEGRKVLRCAAVYGANASGKSNLVRALRFVQDLVLTGTKADAEIPTISFKLDREMAARPSHFEVEIAGDGRHFSYGFEVTRKRVEAEWLAEVRGGVETMLFERSSDPTGFELGELGGSTERRQFFRFVAEGTRPNQLFLTEIVEKNATEFTPLIRAIRDISTIRPNDSLTAVVEQARRDRGLVDFASGLVAEAGAGVSAIEVFSQDLETFGALPDELRDFLRTRLGDRGALVHADTEIGYFSEDTGRTVVEVLVPMHADAAGKRVPFRVDEESDGTRRLLSLAPALYRLGATADLTFAIDELERSLHHQLTRRFLERFFSVASGQLLFTTHDTNLLDARLLSRDSIWFAEKDRGGGSKLYPLTSFNASQLARLEGHLESGYLEGRFGAIPFFGDPERLGGTHNEG